MAFKNAATVSTTYTLMSRCGLNPGDHFEHEDFLSVFDFNTRDTIAALGSVISNTSEQVLRQIEVSIKNYEREASLQAQAERTQYHEEKSELHADRGLLDPEPDPFRDRDEAPGQVRTDEEAVSAGEPAGTVEQHGRISSSNKQWAKGIEIPQDKTAWNSASYRRFVVGNAHPGLVDLFVNQVRKEVELMKERKPSVLKN